MPCTTCGSKGHNIRTCQFGSKPQSKKTNYGVRSQAEKDFSANHEPYCNIL